MSDPSRPTNNNISDPSRPPMSVEDRRNYAQLVLTLMMQHQDSVLRLLNVGRNAHIEAANIAIAADPENALQYAHNAQNAIFEAVNIANAFLQLRFLDPVDTDDRAEDIENNPHENDA